MARRVDALAMIARDRTGFASTKYVEGHRYHVHRLQSAGIDEKTLLTYTGDRMDYDQAVDGLISQRDKARRERAELEAVS